MFDCFWCYWSTKISSWINLTILTWLHRATWDVILIIVLCNDTAVTASKSYTCLSFHCRVDEIWISEYMLNCELLMGCRVLYLRAKRMLLQTFLEFKNICLLEGLASAHESPKYSKTFPILSFRSRKTFTEIYFLAVSYVAHQKLTTLVNYKQKNGKYVFQKYIRDWLKKLSKTLNIQIALTYYI